MRILVPLDGSELAAWALERGAGLFRRGESSVTLLGVAEDKSADLAYRVDPRHGELQSVLAAAREKLRARGVEARAEIRFGDPAEAILREIHEGGYSLVAMTTHGRTGLGRVLFGSVALRVLQGSTAPLLLFRPLLRPDGSLSPVETRDAAPFKKVLALLDGSSLAEEALAPAAVMARRFEGELRLFTAVPGGPQEALHRAAAAEQLEAWSRRLAAGKLRTSFAVRPGAAAPEALAEAREWGADVVALSTHGRTGAARAMYGSVAERILRESSTPLLVVRSRSPAGAVAPAPASGPVVHVK